jgi:hypothetical protein
MILGDKPLISEVVLSQRQTGQSQAPIGKAWAALSEAGDAGFVVGPRTDRARHTNTIGD